MREASDAADAEACGVEVEQQADRAIREFEISDHLGQMHRVKALDRLDLDDDVILDEQVHL